MWMGLKEDDYRHYREELFLQHRLKLFGQIFFRYNQYQITKTIQTNYRSYKISPIYTSGIVLFLKIEKFIVNENKLCIGTKRKHHKNV